MIFIAPTIHAIHGENLHPSHQANEVYAFQVSVENPRSWFEKQQNLGMGVFIWIKIVEVHLIFLYYDIYWYMGLHFLGECNFK